MPDRGAGPKGRGAGKVDIAVAGAGILGCMIAWELAERSPGASIAVLDKATIGGGATLRSAGLDFPRGGTERVRQMAAASQDRYRELARTRPGLPIYQVGMLVLAMGEAPPPAYLPSAQLTRDDWLPARIQAPYGVTAWRGDGCMYADVPAVALALARELRSSGTRVRFREATQVTGLEPTSHQVTLKLGTGETLTAGRVVLAPGPWLAAPAWRDLVAPLGAGVKKVVALHVEQPVCDTDDCVVFAEEDAFLLPLLYRGHWLFSYTCTEWDVDPDELHAGLTSRNIDEAARTLQRYAPGFAARLTEGGGRVFCDAYSGTGEPLVRALDDDGRLVFAGAANGSGYRLAPAMATQAVDLLLSSGSLLTQSGHFGATQ
jgi:glycine/D-amino acid oxidase-like deaminating enzyme